MTSKKIQELENKILYHKELYYAGKAEISDEEYDQVEEELRYLDPENRVLQIVGTVKVSGEKVKHQTKMLSLAKTYKLDELLSWKGSEDILSMFKIDGTSCSLIYEKGILKLGKTRGNGEYGENITEKVRFIPSVPLKLKENIDMEVRGEIFCYQSKFIALSEDMIKEGLEKPNSLRNIVAGLLGRKEKVFLAKHLNFQAFEVFSEKEFAAEEEKLTFLKKQGFHIPHVRVHKDEKTIKETLEEAQDFMSEEEYLIDGVVFVFNNLELHDRLGATSHHPRYKMAYKFQGMSKETIINSISWQISRNGIATPVGEVEPVELSGAMISRVSLHNLGIVKQHQLKKGDRIEIVRSGEVIPKFLSVIKSSNEKFLIPKKCPSCSESLEIDDIRLVCKNPLCPAQIQEEILHFIRKIGIDDLSSKRLEEMINKGLVKGIPSLYRLKKEDLLELDKVKEKLASKIIKNIEKTKKINLVNFLTALGISGASQNKIEKIIDYGYRTLGDFEKLTSEKLIEIESFAQKSAEDFISSFKSKKAIIQELIDLGFKVEEVDFNHEGALKDKKFCITGTLSMKRSDIESLIKGNSGTVVSSVSKNTDYLVTNDTESSSSKFKKANSLKIPIINEKMLLDLIKKT